MSVPDVGEWTSAGCRDSNAELRYGPSFRAGDRTPGMALDVDGSALGSAVETTVSLLTAVGRWAARATWTLLTGLLSLAMLVGQLSVSRMRGAFDRVVTAAEHAPLREASRTTSRWLFGRRLDVSLLVVLVAPFLALVANYWAVGVGYPRLERWVRGTWHGTNPQLFVFLAVATLVALAALSAAVNSGLVPTTVLVTAPLFGVAFSRYGLTLEPYGTVGLPNAVGVGLTLAAAFGVPLACTGFALGSVARLTRELLRKRAGQGPWTDSA